MKDDFVKDSFSSWTIDFWANFDLDICVLTAAIWSGSNACCIPTKSPSPITKVGVSVPICSIICSTMMYQSIEN